MYEFFRWLALITGWPMQLLLFKRKTYYEDKKEQGRIVKGGALVISNHYSVFDYMVNMFLFPFRKLFVVYKAEKSFHFGMKFFGGIKAERDAKGMRFIDDSVKLLEYGKMVQIFPEAKISYTKQMDEFKPSYIMIALRSGAPIIPVITDGNYGIFKRVHVIIGKKIYLSDYCSSLNPTKEEIISLNNLVKNKALELQKELYANIEKDSKRK